MAEAEDVSASGPKATGGNQSDAEKAAAIAANRARMQAAAKK